MEIIVLLLEVPLVLSTTDALLSALTDNSNGTYTATLTLFNKPTVTSNYYAETVKLQYLLQDKALVEF